MYGKKNFDYDNLLILHLKLCDMTKSIFLWGRKNKYKLKMIKYRKKCNRNKIK